MRFRFKPTAEQRSALRAQLTRLQQPTAVLEVLRCVLPTGFNPTAARCTPLSIHSDRFVLRAQVRSGAGQDCSYALKVYADEFGQQIWRHSRALNEHSQPNGNGLCLPTTYLPQERMLIFPWVDGVCLSEIVDGRKPELLRQAAQIAASLHCSGLVPEQPTTAQMIVRETRDRCERLRRRWPAVAPVIEPLLASLEEGLILLEPAELAAVHGDMAAGQFLWTGQRLVLLDLDMFGYTDPAYDAGHFLAQLERRCVLDPLLRAHTAQWLACFRDSYLEAMPKVSPRNLTFYRGLTLVRKIYTLCRKQTGEWPQMILQLAVRARAALQELAPAGQTL